MNWNKWVRQTHRWLSIAFTVGVIVNIVAVAQKKYTVWVGLLALLPLALQLFTMSKGMAAPTANVAADVSAACTGRAVVVSEIPSSSRA